ncbi:MAG: helix-turn-helix domain-containing protein [Anaerolineaceae bacterium]|nr:helix-turn-helix domain-containing protein [Anaerolineaceae bacterium]
MLRKKAMTGAQLARAMNISRPRAHYYLKTLLSVGLVVFKEERISNGMIGKYYRALANYFSYDDLAAQSREKTASDPSAIEIFKAISNFALTVMETSRDNILKSNSLANLARGFHFNFDADLSEAQSETILKELRAVAEHLMEIKRQNSALRKPEPLSNFRTTIFFTPIPANFQEEDMEEQDSSVENE